MLEMLQNLSWKNDNIPNSEGQEKYIWELSITPVGYFTGARKKSLGRKDEMDC
jgi:hypothetical protein